MAVPYELIVKEDLEIGVGTVSRTMPGGGSATGNKIGLHTFLGTVYNVKDFGAIGDGVANDAVAIQAAITAGSAVYFPPGTYFIGTTTLVPLPGQTLYGSDYATTIVSYSGTGSAFKITNAVNGSGYGLINWRNLTITCTNGASAGAGIELLAGGHSYYRVEYCRITGTFKYGLILDQVEVSSFHKNIIENGNGVSNSACIWVTNGDERRLGSGASLGFSNRISIVDNQFNSATYGIIDDGGSNISIIDNNFNGHSIAIHMAGRIGFIISENEMENTSGQVQPLAEANIRLSDRSGVGGGAVVDKTPCRGGTINGNVFSMNVSGGATAMLLFTATTAAAYHRGITVTGNSFYFKLGRGVAIDVTRLGWSMCGYNQDDAANTFFHYGGQHHDANGNTLLTPGDAAEADYFRLCGNPNIVSIVNGGLQVGPDGSAQMRQIFYATAVWDPANLAADGDVTATGVTVTGVLPGYVCWASHDQLPANNVIISAHVQAADTVRVIIMNKTGGALNIASGTVTVYAVKPV